MAGTLTDRQRSSEYYRIAYKCAETKATTGCNGNCAMCVLNVHLYVDDAREATLIKTSAAMDYGKWDTTMRDKNKSGWLSAAGGLLAIAVVILMVALPTQCVVKSCKQAFKPRAPVSEVTDDVLYNAAAYAKYNLKDVNGDGLKDCIDYALLYKEVIRDARLIWNYNKMNGWSHLFVQVNGKYIEPSAVTHDAYQRDIAYWFQYKYNPLFNKDVTTYEYSIRNGTMWWDWEQY
jgi:hypothetical protein